jgi:hypothetical protein
MHLSTSLITDFGFGKEVAALSRYIIFYRVFNAKLSQNSYGAVHIAFFGFNPVHALARVGAGALCHL